MRTAKTISDLRELFNDYAVIPVLNGNKVYLAMPDSEEWEPDCFQRGQLITRTQSVIESDPPGVQFSRQSHNAVLALVLNPQFTRKTTVADQVSRFYGEDQGAMPPMFLRGENRQPSKNWAITGLTKKAGEEFTMHFVDPYHAEFFIKAIANGETYYTVHEELVVKQ